MHTDHLEYYDQALLLQLPPEVLAHIVTFLPEQDAKALADSRALLSAVLWHNLLKQSQHQRVSKNVHLLKGVIDKNSKLKARWEQEPRLINKRFFKVLDLINTIAEKALANDPLSAWKIAAICGFKKLLLEYFGDDIQAVRDEYGCGVLAYAALGGQVELIEYLIDTYYKNFNREHDDPSDHLVKMAAIGGHANLLMHLQQHYGYKLNIAFSTDTKQEQTMTLLELAIRGGHDRCVAILNNEELTQSAQSRLAIIAASEGHWSLYKKFTPVEKNFTADQAQELAQYACLHNNLELIEELLDNKNYTINKEQLFTATLEGGHSEIFWHFVRSNELSLDHSFLMQANVLHLLAKSGHTALIKHILSDSKLTQNIDLCSLDWEGKSVLHYAASGDQWETYCYLNKNDTANKIPRKDEDGNNVAHIAAQNGAANFLHKLYLDKNHSKLLFEVNNNQESILHLATAKANPFILDMLITRLKIDPLLQNNRGDTALHMLSRIARRKPHFWQSVGHVIKICDHKILDIKNKKGLSVRDSLFEQKQDHLIPSLISSQSTIKN